MSEIWKGVALPWGSSVNSFIAPKNDEDVIRSSVIWIILTRLGERVCMPEFGSLLPSSVFEPGDSELTASVRESVVDAIRRWDDRVEVVNFEAIMSPETHTLNCKLLYKNRKDPLADTIKVAEFGINPTMLM